MEQKYKLIMKWSKKENDLICYYPLGRGTKNDSNFILSLLGDKVTEELEKRGYDIEKIRFEIPIKLEDNPNPKKFETLLKGRSCSS